MKGSVIGSVLIGSAVIAGAGLYYLQVYHWYDRVPAGTLELGLVTSAGDAEKPFSVNGLQAIDAGSSPIRFRACFETPARPDDLAETYTTYDGAEPLTAPGWFDCFDASEIGAALASGTATAFLSRRGVATGVDRVVAVMDDGRGYAWHQLQPGFGE